MDPTVNGSVANALTQGFSTNHAPMHHHHHPQQFQPVPTAEQPFIPLTSNANTGPTPLQLLSDAAAAPRSPDRDGDHGHDHGDGDGDEDNDEMLAGDIGVGEHDPLRDLFGNRFDTFDEAHVATEEIARRNGFALSIRSKRPTATNFNRAVLACSQGGKYKASHTAEPTKRRQTSTLKTGCTYKVAIKRNKLGKWIVESVMGNNRDRHNHGMLSTGAFARYRHRLVEAVRDELAVMWEEGLKASVIRERLVDGRPHYGCVTIHDVRNAMKRYERDRDRGTHSQGPQTPTSQGPQTPQDPQSLQGFQNLQSPPGPHVVVQPMAAPHSHIPSLPPAQHQHPLPPPPPSAVPLFVPPPPHHPQHPQHQAAEALRQHYHQHPQIGGVKPEMEPGYVEQDLSAHPPQEPQQLQPPQQQQQQQHHHDLPLNIPIDPAVTQDRAEEANM